MRNKTFWLEADKDELQAELEKIEAEMDRVWEEYTKLIVEKSRIQKEIDWMQDPENTVESVLLANTKEWLVSCADYVNLTLRADQKEEIAHELAVHLLKPETMREELFWFDEEALNLFEEVIEKGGVDPVLEDEKEILNEFWDIAYISVCEDEDGREYQVPADARAVYAGLWKEGYRELHRKIRWLYSCMSAFERIYAIAPVKVLHRMYRKDEALRLPYQQFLKLLDVVPEQMNPFRMEEGILISRKYAENCRYQELNLLMPEIGYYIPEKEEILEYAKEDYPLSQTNYGILKALAHTILKMSDENSADLCRTIHDEMFTAGVLKDLQHKSSDIRIHVSSEVDAKMLSDVIWKINENTRMVALRGHTQSELRDCGMMAPVGMVPVIQKQGGKTVLLLTDARNGGQTDMKLRI